MNNLFIFIHFIAKKAGQIGGDPTKRIIYPGQ